MGDVGPRQVVEIDDDYERDIYGADDNKLLNFSRPAIQKNKGLLISLIGNVNILIAQFIAFRP